MFVSARMSKGGQYGEQTQTGGSRFLSLGGSQLTVAGGPVRNPAGALAKPTMLAGKHSKVVVVHKLLPDGRKRLVLLDESKGSRKKWAGSIGNPYPLSIDLNVDVSDIHRDKIEYQVRGTVDVPSPPRNDDERNFLAKLLIDATGMPQRDKRGWHLHRWVATKGGAGIHVRKCTTIPQITEKHIIGEVKVFTPPKNEELDEKDLISDEKHNEWVQEYGTNRYCRFESRQELNQRWQDIQVNTQVLKPSGKTGLTNEEIWYRLGQHVIVEMLLRGEPPKDKNLDPRVTVAQPFFDGELCRKAASIVSARGTENDVLIKYGKTQYMKDLYEKGLVYMNVASNYDQPSHNLAVRDDEREFVFKGAFGPADRLERHYNSDNVPGNIEQLFEDGLANFSPIFECPSLEPNECVDETIRMQTNYWAFCMSDVLDQRLFADFEADSCVIMKRTPFIERLLSAVRLQLPNVTWRYGSVDYVDPLGAFPASGRLPIKPSMPVHMTKLFRYAYQREVRFVCLPERLREDLCPRPVVIGPISDIAEFVVL